MRKVCRMLLHLTFAIIPVLCLTVTASNALFCALAVFLALMLSCAVRITPAKIIPEQAKNFVIIIAVALGISIVELFSAGKLNSDIAAAAFMPLCAVPALLLLGETSAEKGAKATFIKALITGGLYTALLVAIGAIRELIGSGCIFGLNVTRSLFDPIKVLAMPAGAIFVIALFIAVLKHIAKEDEADA